MVKSNLSTDDIICPNCNLMNSRGTGTSHEVREFFSSLPDVFIMSVKRFEYDQIHGQGRKIGNSVYPSNKMLLKKNGQVQKFHLKSVVEHHGMSLASGHYTSKISMNDKWLVCNDNDNIKVSRRDPLSGYLFLYEKTPLNISQDTLATILIGIEELNQQEVDINNPQTENGRPSNPEMKTAKESTMSNEPNFHKEKPAETSSKEGVDSVESVEVQHLTRFEIIKILENMQFTCIKNRNTEQLRNSLRKNLESRNPIHDFLKTLSIQELKNIALKVNIQFNRTQEEMRKRLAKH